MALLGTVVFVVALAASIAIHEWGHFITARRFGMRAERYFIGFGPTLWSTRRGETEYGVKWLPFGGFVRIAGMSHEDRRLPPVAAHVFDPDAVAADRQDAAGAGADIAHVPAVPQRTWERLDDELARRGVPGHTRADLIERTRRRLPSDATAREAAEALEAAASEVLPDTGDVGDLRHRVLRGDEGRFFKDRPAWQRAIVLSAGSGMHFAQAIVLLFVAFWAFGVQQTTTIGEVLPGTPAQEAGLAEGDRLVAIAGERLDDFEQARGILAAHPGETVTVTIERDGETRDVEMTTAVVVADVAPDSASAAAGLAPRDRIVAVDGEPVRSAADLRATSREVTLTVERYVADEDGETRTERADVALSPDDLDELELAGMAGFVPTVEGLGPVEAARETFVGEGSFPAMVGATFDAFGAILGPEGLGALPEQLSGAERDPTGASLASPVGLAQVAGEGTAVAGLFFLLGLLAALNVFIGIFNLVPLPPLDGGHLAVLAVERTVNAVRARRGAPTDYEVDPRTITAIALPVIVLLGLVFIAVLILDITNPLRLPQ